VAGQGKTIYLLANPPTPVIDALTLLTTMKTKIQDLVLYCMIVKELWCFCEIPTEETTISIGFMMLYMSCFRRSKMADPWMITTVSSIT